ncbi:tripartite tricarboxylate transporter TctB family protein [Nitratireductor sp. ZSWI3]|uniref:tripartite tricarboxylate transporter TctB family protein n=1 Tax=Nitratireductor sp. ZSWI3 TaxID=2966359 RepID=UPI00214F77B1|nr:tripartite tricarboxylate transporter TctB family protein [Nitratireductor sp. ZSWI3]MCR4265392.1 tripartite tricarboxylate transporter TctB family protein [Nitratireductor sp. ZSWI3]
MKPSEIVLLAGLAVFSGVLLWNGLDMPYGSAQSFGPGYIPLNIAVVTLVLIALLAARALAARRSAPPAQAIPGESLGAVLPVVAVIVLMAAAIYAMSLGSVLAPLGVLMVLLSWRFAGHPPLKSLFVSAAILAVIYAIFSLWLKIPLI